LSFLAFLMPKKSQIPLFLPLLGFFPPFFTPFRNKKNAEARASAFDPGQLHRDRRGAAGGHVGPRRRHEQLQRAEGCRWPCRTSASILDSSRGPRRCRLMCVTGLCFPTLGTFAVSCRYIGDRVLSPIPFKSACGLIAQKTLIRFVI